MPTTPLQFLNNPGFDNDSAMASLSSIQLWKTQIYFETTAGKKQEGRGIDVATVAAREAEDNRIPHGLYDMQDVRGHFVAVVIHRLEQGDPLPEMVQGMFQPTTSLCHYTLQTRFLRYPPQNIR